MLRRRGLNATSVRELAKHANAPLGSTYHYFPGGKYELAAEAVRWADGVVARGLAKALNAGPVAGLRSFLELWRNILLDNDFRAGCPVLAVSVEELPDGATAPRDAAAAAFTNWTAMLTRALSEHGADEAQALNAATLVVAAVEGTVAMCRAQRSTAPLDRVTPELVGVVTRALGGA